MFKKIIVLLRLITVTFQLKINLRFYSFLKQTKYYSFPPSYTLCRMYRPVLNKLIHTWKGGGVGELERRQRGASLQEGSKNTNATFRVWCLYSSLVDGVSHSASVPNLPLQTIGVAAIRQQINFIQYLTFVSAWTVTLVLKLEFQRITAQQTQVH